MTVINKRKRNTEVKVENMITQRGLWFVCC